MCSGDWSEVGFRANKALFTAYIAETHFFVYDQTNLEFVRCHAENIPKQGAY